MSAGYDRRNLRALLVVATVSLVALAEAGAYGRYLRDPAQSSIVNVYGGTGGGNPAQPIQFDRAVRDSTKNIDAGMIRFDYDTYHGDNAGQGGAALSGGFFQNAGVDLKPGFRLAWVQTVIATRTGTDGVNGWNLPGTGAGEYPDAPPTDPRYPFTTPATVNVPFAPPTFGFQDFPGRNFAEGNQNWLAELGLVCISDTANIQIGGQNFREVRVINTFLWGFNLVGLPVANPGIGNVQSNPPAFWSSPTASYVNTLNNFYDGLGGGGGAANGGAGVASARYRFFKNDNCFIPEPASLMLLVLGAVATLRRRSSLN